VYQLFRKAAVSHIAVILARSFLSGRTGNVAIIFALSLPLVLGGAALGVEAGSWYFDQVKLQQMADTAAYAAAVDNRAGKASSIMLASATSAAGDNGYNSSTDTLTLNTPPTSGSNQNANSSEILLTRTEQRLISQFFDTSPVIVKARAVATYVSSANACVLALDPSASQAVTFSGSSTVSLNGCNVMANSISSTSIYSQGSTSVSVPCLMTAGDVSINTGVTQTACTSAMTQLAPVADPFRNVAEPADTGNCQNSNGATLQPGRYCGGLSINSSVNLKPGVYIIDGGTFKANGNAAISGSGVTFVMANNASLSFNGNAVLNVSAPTSGTYAGMLFFGSRSNSTSASVTINGASSSVMTGAVYFPNQPVYYTGNFQGANGCTQVVARTVAWSGNSNLAVNCSAYGMTALPVGGVVKIVE
jgi:Flp pilus assembly protein TadG